MCWCERQTLLAHCGPVWRITEALKWRMLQIQEEKEEADEEEEMTEEEAEGDEEAVSPEGVHTEL